MSIGHHHDHDHSHGGHAHHDHTHGANERSVGIAAALTGAFMIAEVAGGLASGSLALLADAGHMLTDFAGLSMAWLAFVLARRPASWKRTYGFDRFSVLVAFVNGMALFVIAGGIVLEAWHRIEQPVRVVGGLMFWIALAGLAVNIAAFLILSRGDRENLNIRAAVLHVAGDLLGSVAAIVASLVIVTTGWMPIDPILSVLVALIILRSAASVVRDSANILLEASPPSIDVRDIAADLTEAVDGVIEVHHVHAWSITQERPMVTFHAKLRPGTDGETAVSAIKRRMHEKFGIDHSTVEVEQGRCADHPTQGAGHGHAAAEAARCRM